MRRVRRRIARWLAPAREAELRETKRKLRAARRRARAARHGLPANVEETVALARAEHLTLPELIEDLIEDTIQLDEPVAFTHLDGDWYESPMTCLTRIAPLVVPGGRIVLHDCYKWSGCRAAVDEYFEDRRKFRLERRSKLHVARA